MISPTKLRENKIHAEAENAKRKASKGGTYVARGDDVFEFIPAPDLPYEEGTLADKFAAVDAATAAQIAALEAQNAALREEIAALRNEVNNTLASHQKAIMALAETVSQNNVL